MSVGISIMGDFFSGHLMLNNYNNKSHRIIKLEVRKCMQF